MKNKTKNEVKSSRKNENNAFEKVIGFLDKNRKIIYGFIGGVLVSAIVTTIIWPDRIATLADGTQPVAEIKGEKITADKLYETLKAENDVDSLLKIVDNLLLTEMYEEDDEMIDEVNKTAEDYYSQAASYYQWSEKEFLEYYGYESNDDFLEDLKLNYRRNKYYKEYTESLITEDEINDYYENKVYGDIDSKHILVTVDDNRTDEDAKALAEEIIGKLEEGKTFDEVKTEYEDSITYEELGYQPFNAGIETNYMNALKNLENDKYTTEPIQTSYGYHIIYRIDQKEKPSLEDIKDTIIEAISTEKMNSDENLYAKSLINLREENEFSFYDTVLEDKYNKYTDSIK